MKTQDLHDANLEFSARLTRFSMMFFLCFCKMNCNLPTIIDCHFNPDDDDCGHNLQCIIFSL
jgi:hypothetical protein